MLQLSIHALPVHIGQLFYKILTKKVYYNEKNKYGYKPRLKSNAIKLFILLHFYNPNKFGIINNVSLKDLVHYLHCNIKTIINNLDILTMYGYLSYSKKMPILFQCVLMITNLIIFLLIKRRTRFYYYFFRTIHTFN